MSNEEESSSKNLSNTSNLPILANYELIKQGAEAKIYTGIFDSKPAIAKERFKKNYRHPDLDKVLTRRRIKNEVKLLEKARSIGIQVPNVYKVDQTNGVIIMEFIQDAVTCREYIINLVTSKTETTDEINKKLIKMSNKIGNFIGKLHYTQIMHGDLTTSNMLFKNPTQNEDDEIPNIYFIDFGLSFLSTQLEDKAVDLYVLERALLSTHSQHATFIFEHILKGYQYEYKTNFEQILDRLNQVRLRGRKRSMIG